MGWPRRITVSTRTWSSPTAYLVVVAVAAVVFFAALVVGPKLNMTSFDRTRSICLACIAALGMLIVYGVAHTKADEARLAAELERARSETAKLKKEVQDSDLSVCNLTDEERGPQDQALEPRGRQGRGREERCCEGQGHR